MTIYVDVAEWVGDKQVWSLKYYRDPATKALWPDRGAAESFALEVRGGGIVAVVEEEETELPASNGVEVE